MTDLVQADFYPPPPEPLSRAARSCRAVVNALMTRGQWWAILRLAPVGLRIAPGDPELLVRLAAALPSEASQRTFELCLEAGSGAVRTGEARLVVLAADMLLGLGAEPDSISEVADFAAQMETVDDYVRDYLVNLRGLIAARKGDCEVAERLLWEAAHLDPRFSRFLDDLVRFLLDRGRLDEARSIAHERVPGISRPDLLSTRMKELLAD